MLLALIAHRVGETNAALAAAAPPGVEIVSLTPTQALVGLQPGDAALGRLDVLPTLDGVDDGMAALGALAARGVRVLNAPSALLAAHDKLLTARVLVRAGLPHPRTRLLEHGGSLPDLDVPLVVKPRFGSWGRDVALVTDARALRRHLAELERRPWFRAQGALVQELVTPQGSDLRLVVCGGCVVGAVSRIAQHGEWRTNVALGARRVPVRPPPAACELAVRAAAATGAALLGIDLLPDGAGGWTILELNGAVDFTPDYGLDGDPFAAAAAGLARLACGDAERRPPLVRGVGELAELAGDEIGGLLADVDGVVSDPLEAA
jgi:RimK family alpha-L-glutamate ligase